MRLGLLILVLCLAVLAFWLTGGLALVEAWAIQGQRQMQSALAEAIRHLKRGEPGAMTALLGLCFTYGVLHAVGPGHGKVLIGAHALGHRVPWGRLVALALVASLAQSAVAVGVVQVLVGILGWKRDPSQAFGAEILSPLGAVVIGLLGLWLVWRGGRKLLGRQDHGHDHDHPHVHAHGPSLHDMEHLHGLRDALVLIGGIAMRPCTGALLLLILTWQIGIPGAGIAGAFAMGLGTATITVLAALLALWARDGVLASLPAEVAARTLPWIELLAGLLVILIAAALFSAPA